MDHARKLKFNIYVQLPSINIWNVSISLRLSDSIQCRGYYFDHGCYTSALEYIRMLILSKAKYILVACINTIYKYGHGWVILLG